MVTYHQFCKDTEPFMYSLVSLLSSIYPVPAMHSLLVTLYVTEYAEFQGQNIGCIKYEAKKWQAKMDSLGMEVRGWWVEQLFCQAAVAYFDHAKRCAANVYRWKGLHGFNSLSCWAERMCFIYLSKNKITITLNYLNTAKTTHVTTIV